ncbi:MAG: diguanylate cyclase [Planctomycetota bacterium]|nr:diguanylate cyclase [Planctomycetota bacterium]
MTRPGFRKGRVAAGKAIAAASPHEGFVSGALFSQAQILHLMKTEFARARRHHIPLSCMILQVDRLAQLIDLYGADLRLRVRETLARLVREKTRGADLLGTVSDDRYLLMLPHTDMANSRIVADRLHGMFSEFEIQVDSRALDLKLSIGLAASNDQQTMFFDTLIGQAESALEWAAGQGGNRVAAFGEVQLREGEDLPPADEP